MRLFVLLSVLSVCLLSLAFGEDYQQIQHLATWSPERPLQDPTTYTPAPDGCAPHSLVLLSRHGNRNPTSSNVRNLSDLAKKLATTNPNPTFAWLKTWKNPVPTSAAGALLASGERALYDLAKRYKTYFPTLFSAPYTPDTYPMRATSVQRVVLSGVSFGYGLFEGTGTLPGGYKPVMVIPGSEVSDPLLRFFDECPLLTETVTTPGNDVKEQNLWQAKVNPGIAQEISALTGIQNLTANDVQVMWTGCQMEAGAYGKLDGLCTLFDQSRTLKMEYGEDLNQYYSTSYGYDLNWQVAAPLVSEFISRLKAAANTTTPIPASLFFGHAETVLPFSAILGFRKDGQKLTSSSPDDVIANRQFRSALISPFAGNAAFALYKCPSDFKVKILFNEKEETLPGCSSLYCPLTEFSNILKDRANWDLKNNCALPTTAAPTTAAPPTTTAAPTTGHPTTAAPTAAPTTATPPPATPPPTNPPAPAPNSKINFGGLMNGFRS